MVKKLDRLKALGLIGCLNESEINNKKTPKQKERTRDTGPSDEKDLTAL